MRLPAILLALALATPACAEDGVYVWNDPVSQSIRMLRFAESDFTNATADYTLQKLSPVSATMTGVDYGGKAIGLCRQELNDNDAPAWLSGFDLDGKQRWEKPAGDYLPALEALLPKGYRTGEDVGWFTFSCKDAGAANTSGVLAFDVGFSAGKPEADGFVRRDDALDFTARLYVSPKTGKVLDAALVENRVSRLKLGPNPKQQLYVDAEHQVLYFIADGPGVMVPKGGRGQLLWNDRPIMWQGRAQVSGTDFAWYLPVKRPD